MARRNIVLSDELDRNLNEAATLLGEKRSRIVSIALSQYLDRLDLEVARERAAEHEASPGSSVSAAELRERLGL